MDEQNLEYNFGQGFVQNDTVCRVISQYDGLVEYGSKTSSLMMWSKRKKGWFHYHLGWTAIRLACSKSAMYALGADGHFLVANAAGVKVEELAGSSDEFPYRDVCLAGETIFVLGGHAGVQRRGEGEAGWEACGEGLPLGEAAAKDRAELVSIHGVNEGELYAVGKNGAIWRYTDSKWSRLESPTEQDLLTVRVTESGRVYATGNGGLVLQGSGRDFECIGSTGSEDAVHGLTWFQGNVYVADEKNLYVLRDNGVLDKVVVPNGPGWTFKHLHSTRDVMWSFGEKHIFWTDDATHWHNETPSFTLFDPSESGPMAAKSSCGCTGGAHHC